jgi:hypothetical protein
MTKIVAPSVMDVVGQTGSQAPQEMHSSVIFIAMVFSPVCFSNSIVDVNGFKHLSQMTNIVRFARFVISLFCPVDAG